MRKFKYNEQGVDEPVVITEEEILKIYYKYWCSQMKRVGKGDMISEQACIEDWVVIHWAWEVKE